MSAYTPAINDESHAWLVTGNRVAYTKCAWILSYYGLETLDEHVYTYCLSLTSNKKQMEAQKLKKRVLYRHMIRKRVKNNKVP